MTRQGSFKMIWWKWYLVDVTNWHHPVVMRKHFERKEMADQYRKKYCGKDFETIRGKEAMALNISDWHNYKPGHRHIQVINSKYNYPPHVKTDKQKHIYRKNRRRSMKQNIHKPKITDAALIEILHDKPMLFYKRFGKLTNYYQAYSKPVRGLYKFRRTYKWPIHVVRLSAIILTLDKYYDPGPYDPIDLAIYIYEGWPERIEKRIKGGSTADKLEEEVAAEFKARGFIKYSNSGFDEECNYIHSIHIKPKLVYPELAWHEYSQSDLYKYYIYNLGPLVGIPGFTGTHVAGLRERS